MTRRRRLLLARHGETEWNAIGRLQGHTDIPLNERGRHQARALAESLANHDIASVITSDLARARETGAIIAELLALPPPRVITELRERRFGVFEGLTRDECMTRYPDAWKAWHARTGVPDGAEALDVVTARIDAVLENLSREPGGTALVIAHGGVMRLWIERVLAVSMPPLENGATFVIDHDGARFSVRAVAGPADRT